SASNWTLSFSSNNLRDFAGGDAVYDHLHHGQNKGLFTALITGEQFRGELTATDTGHTQGKGTNPRMQLMRVVTVAISLAMFGPLITLCFQLFRHLCLQDLVQYRFQQLGDT